MKLESWHFHVVVVQGRQINVQKSVMHDQSCCFGQQTYCLYFDVLVAIAVIVTKAPFIAIAKRISAIDRSCILKNLPFARADGLLPFEVFRSLPVAIRVNLLPP